jgi:hypothetical protein
MVDEESRVGRPNAGSQPAVAKGASWPEVGDGRPRVFAHQIAGSEKGFSIVERLVPMIDLLVERPHWPNALIARRVGCDRRRVRRYRRIILSAAAADNDFEPRTLQGCDAATLNRFFNFREKTGRSPQYAPPDFQALELRHPGKDGLSLWNVYAAEKALAREPAMSYSQFMRTWRKLSS